MKTSGTDGHCRGEDQNIFNDVLTFERRDEKRLPGKTWKQDQWQDRTDQM